MWKAKKPVNICVVTGKGNEFHSPYATTAVTQHETPRWRTLLEELMVDNLVTALTRALFAPSASQ
jgi:hypothetical protein